MNLRSTSFALVAVAGLLGGCDGRTEIQDRVHRERLDTELVEVREELQTKTREFEILKEQLEQQAEQTEYWESRFRTLADSKNRQIADAAEEQRLSNRVATLERELREVRQQREVRQDDSKRRGELERDFSWRWDGFQTVLTLGTIPSGFECVVSIFDPVSGVVPLIWRDFSGDLTSPDGKGKVGQGNAFVEKARFTGGPGAVIIACNSTADFGIIPDEWFKISLVRSPRP